MIYTVNGQEGHLTQAEYPGLTLLIADRGPVNFRSIDVHIPHIPIEETSDGSFIQDNGSTNHTLPAHAAIPILHESPIWNAPDESTIAQIKLVIEETTNVLDLGSPDMERIRRFISLLEDKNQPLTVPMSQTDMGWQERHFHHTFGGSERTGWYEGALFRSGANGWDNDHYGRVWWMMIRFVYEPSEVRRAQLWPYLLQKCLAHLCYGRFWGGPHKGLARDEKGNTYVGDSNRVPYSKQWIENVVAGWLLTGHEAFDHMIENAVVHYDATPVTKVWQGYWGTRLGARALEEYTTLALVRPLFRTQMVSKAKQMLDQFDVLLDRDHYVWPNLGNNGAAEESPWMHWQVIAAIFRCWELLPETILWGPTEEDLAAVAVNLLEKGSERINGYPLTRYRFHTTTTPARFLANTAFSLPALRYLKEWDSFFTADYHKVREVVSDYAGCYVSDVAAGVGRLPENIGFRDPSQGPAWSKAMLMFIGAMR